MYSTSWFFYNCVMCYLFFFFKQKTAYEMRISDWSSDVCSSDLFEPESARLPPDRTVAAPQRGGKHLPQHGRAAPHAVPAAHLQAFHREEAGDRKSVV